MTALDPELAAAIEDVEAVGVPEWHQLSVANARRVEDDVFTPDQRRDVAFVRDLAFAGPDGDIPVRVYHDDPDRPAPVVVFYHGGGWTLGTLDSIGGVCREVAARAGCVVVSVDYRLAPEHPFPEPLDDAYAALEWTIETADAFGGDPERVAVAGTSAGGNLAAAVALRARDFDGPEITSQHLLYPMTDRDTTRPSYGEHGDGPLLTRADIEWFWKNRFRSPVDAANPYASVLRANHADLPPATVVTAGHDPLRDEGRAYADALDDAGTPVERLHFPTMAHGFLSLSDDVAVADDGLDTVATHIRALG
ncbi:alpha/beta hydrolase [Halobacterium sp. KA-6]|uniref:alpha/beta hydrolase n=1 Tax=Halobacterium sp. KA-6 TaxID=2896368 RepID=UPI001E48ECBD|nr:alpha/beta hydrolase [Halobacterium sp. KA-6]MCD2202611.1 alpha/beta hydrolase [Halobacterium sp. KA-6]